MAMKWNKFWVREDGKEYDEAIRRSAGQKAAIYYLVALYVGYMGYSIMKNRLTGDETMTYPLAILLTVLLVTGALWIIWYATSWMKKQFEKSVIGEIKKEIE